MRPLLLTIGAGLVLATLATWSAHALASLATAYRDRAAASTAAVVPAIVGPAERTLKSSDLGRAVAELGTMLGDSAALTGVRLSITPPPGGEQVAGVARLHVIVRGEEPAVRAFARSVEDGRAEVAWADWSIVPGGDGRLLLSGDVIAPWARS